MHCRWTFILVLGLALLPRDLGAQEAPDPAGGDAQEAPELPDGEVQAEDPDQGEAQEEELEQGEVEAEDPDEGARLEAERRAIEEALKLDLGQGQGVAVGDAGAVTGEVGASALQSMNPEISLILNVAAAAFSTDEPLQVGAHDPNKTGFVLQQLELFASSAVDPFFMMQTNIVFSQFGVEVEEAFATTHALPGSLQVRAGQFLTRFGRQNPTHLHAWGFLDQPLVLGKFFGAEGSRGLGAELSWLLPLPWFVEVIGSATDSAGECCARSFYGGRDLGVSSPLDLLATGAVKQFFELSGDWSLMLGLSTQSGPNPTGQGNRSGIYGVDLLVRYRPLDDPDRSSLSLQIEALVRTRQVPGDVLVDEGGYAQLLVDLDPSWQLGGRVELVTGLLGDPLDPEQTEARQRVSAQITYRPSHFSKLRLQGSMDAPGWLPEPTLAVMLGFEVLIGAHGAHSY